MITITYISRALKKYSNEELEAMLIDFQIRNNQQNISGVLLYNGAGTFIQTIEGSAEALDSLFSKIKKDPRHSNIVLLHRAEISRPAFEQWRMGFRRIDHDSINNLNATTNFLNDDELEHYVSVNTEFALKVLTNFKDKMKELIF